MDFCNEERAALRSGLERLVREASAAEARLIDTLGNVVAQAADPVPAQVRLDGLSAVGLGPFEQATWESPEGGLHLRRLTAGLLLAVAFDQRSTPGVVRIRSLEFAVSLAARPRLGLDGRTGD